MSIFLKFKVFKFLFSGLQAFRQAVLISRFHSRKLSGLPAGSTDYLLSCSTAALHSFRYLVRQACRHSFIPFINPSIRRAG
ncbi:hypothetical protein HZR05_11860 [Elizabethkingia anophelis]|nr:hypothetical protein [Elizabethkingia anophelis]MCT4311734.1 hypothetical protein [Elizabethkingia anophelis]